MTKKDRIITVVITAVITFIISSFLLYVIYIATFIMVLSQTIPTLTK